MSSRSRYPSRVDRLILLSPAGIPENPHAPTNGEGVNVEEFEAAAKELGESQKSTIAAGKKDGTTTPLEVKDSNHPPTAHAHSAAGTEKKRDNIPKPPTGRSRQRAYRFRLRVIRSDIVFPFSLRMGMGARLVTVRDRQESWSMGSDDGCAIFF